MLSKWRTAGNTKASAKLGEASEQNELRIMLV